MYCPGPMSPSSEPFGWNALEDIAAFTSFAKELANVFPASFTINISTSRNVKPGRTFTTLTFGAFPMIDFTKPNEEF